MDENEKDWAGKAGTWIERPQSISLCNRCVFVGWRHLKHTPSPCMKIEKSKFMKSQIKEVVQRKPDRSFTSIQMVHTHMCVYLCMNAFVQGTRSLGMTFGTDDDSALWRHIVWRRITPWPRLVTTHCLTTRYPLTTHYPLTHCDDTLPDDALPPDHALWRHIAWRRSTPWRRITPWRRLVTTHCLTTHYALPAHYPVTHLAMWLWRHFPWRRIASWRRITPWRRIVTTLPDDALPVGGLGMRSKGAGIR